MTTTAAAGKNLNEKVALTFSLVKLAQRMFWAFYGENFRTSLPPGVSEGHAAAAVSSLFKRLPSFLRQLILPIEDEVEREDGSSLSSLFPSVFVLRSQ